MIANVRMYDVSPEVGFLWRTLLSSIIAKSGVRISWFDYPAPAPIEALWRRPDLGAVFMCGLPFSQRPAELVLLAAPVPEQPASGAEACYWSEFVVRAGSRFQTVEECFGRRLALTVPGSQSGCAAALHYFESANVCAGARSAGSAALFHELLAPTITPMGALKSVVDGAADVAPIDSYAFSLIRAHRPELAAQVRIVGRTAPTPIPPLVASLPPGHGVAVGELPAFDTAACRLSAALLAADTDPTLRPLMDKLLVRRFCRPPPETYDVLARRFEATRLFWRSARLAAHMHPAFTW